MFGLWMFLRWSIDWNILLALPGFVLLYIFLSAFAAIISLICVRFRDVPPLIGALMQLVFFASPIIWQPESLKVGKEILIYNPVAYFLSITRDPVLGRPIVENAWIVTISTTVITIGLALYLHAHYRRRVAFWV